MKVSLNILFICLFAIPCMALAQTTTGSTIPDFSQVGGPDPLSNSSAGTATPNLKQDLADGVQQSQNNNENYYQNALQNPSQPAGSVVQPSAQGAMIATPGGPKKDTQLNLTDAEKKLSEEYIHDGLALRKQKELCEQLDDPNACRGSEPDSKFMGMDAGMVQALSKAYTMVVGLGGMGGGIKMGNGEPLKDGVDPNGKGVTKTDVTTDGKTTTTYTDADGNSTSFDADGKQTSNEGAKQEDRKDYCKYIAVAIEAVAMFQTQMAGKTAEIPANQDTAQKEILYKAARTHKERAKTHKLQFVGWGATTACYAAMMATGADLTSVGNWLKLGAAGLMTAFFKQQADVNEEYYAKVKGIADQLPGKGDCNPITEPDCYCAQEETMNDPNICLPQLHNQNVKLGNYRVACMDANGKVDPKCTCVNQEACLDRKIMNNIKPFGFGTAFNSAALKPLSNLSRGQLTGSDLASADSGQLNAFTRNTIGKLKDKIPSAGGLNGDQQKTVRDLNKLGTNPKLGALLAKQPLSAGARNNFARFRGGKFGSGSRFKNVARNRNKVLNFRGGSGVNKKKSRRGRGNTANFMNRFKKGKKGKKGNRVLNYNNSDARALNNAQINRDKDRPIFEIISRRYKVSGYKRLEVK